MTFSKFSQLLSQRTIADTHLAFGLARTKYKRIDLMYSTPCILVVAVVVTQLLGGSALLGMGRTYRFRKADNKGRDVKAIVRVVSMFVCLFGFNSPLAKGRRMSFGAIDSDKQTNSKCR